MKRIALTGGIACGKSLVAKYLNGLGVETLDADDVVHGLLPDPAERKRLAAEVFSDPEKRRELEARLHPIVKERIDDFLSAAGRGGTARTICPAPDRGVTARTDWAAPGRTDSPYGPCPSRPASLRLAVIPLLFETHWDADYDIICTVISPRETQVERMMTTRGYTREEAEARLAAQLPVSEKAEKSHYVIHNDTTPEALRREVERFVAWLRG